MVRALLVKYVTTFRQELGHIRYLNWGTAIGGTVYVVCLETKHKSPYCLESGDSSQIQGGARNVIPLIVHVTHFYYYKSI